MIDPGLPDETIQERIMAVVRGHFRPEFLNRVDEITVFHRLSRDDLRRIVDIQIGHLQRRLEDRRITLRTTDAAKDWLADRGYDPSFGARPLKRLIQTEIGDRLALDLLEGTAGDGDTVQVDAGNGGLSLTPAS